MIKVIQFKLIRNLKQKISDMKAGKIIAPSHDDHPICSLYGIMTTHAKQGIEFINIEMGAF